MSVGPVNPSTQTQRAVAVEPKPDAPDVKEARPSTDPAQSPAASPEAQQGAREMNVGREQQQMQIQEVRRRGNCGRGRCASLQPQRGLGGGSGGSGDEPPETMLA